MKSILLVRHAKSDWEGRNLSDFERPLNARGHRDAPMMATRLMKSKILPQKIVSSPAVRAWTTAGYFAEAWGIDRQSIQPCPAIYEASVNTLLETVNAFDNQYDLVALFGHNPGITMLTTALSGREIGNMPTCAVALIGFPFHDWREISFNTGDLRLFDFPKNTLL
ncbi:SixA phosphatase family protein [Hufsiella ginkgonis]|uniref:Histidine phosphatase family protein n=1 Tax=Hufsiella ginkgonis TaxID=2695274 RepID=A0A7K1XWL4_9SPHI|nr:histidine phosphatase family protein [Hufsiella ginkgonis]MXV15393.1 histidine phosphatase family protein [Hufsiella ginkgonis]